MTRKPVRIDPSILEIVGLVTQALGLAEQVQKVVPVDRQRAQDRHRRVDKLISKFTSHLHDARTAIRSMSEAIASGATEVPSNAINLQLAPGEFQVLTRSVYRLHDAIQNMSELTFELESATAGLADETDRYYRISQSGAELFESIRSVLGGDSGSLGSVVSSCERYLDRAATMLAERKQWLDS